jgi:hypothetical protein
MERLHPGNTSLWLVTYNRWDVCASTAKQWLASFPFEKINIISNHSGDWRPHFEEHLHPQLNVHYNSLRPNWMTGSLAECWNQCMLNTFETRDWCIMSQDDVTIRPGWADKINSSDYLTYMAPMGDVVVIQSLEGFKGAGWYDERFREVGGADADYQYRCLKSHGARVSVHDDHPWKYRINDVGLAENFERVILPWDGMEWKVNNDFNARELYGRFSSKWGIYVDTLMATHDFTREPLYPDMDWYPSWTDRLKRQGRL